MTYQYLAPNLHETADAAKSFLSSRFGATRIAVEAGIAPELSLRPTLHGHLKNKAILCVEVAERAYSNSLDTFVVECSTRNLPIKLTVALPSARADPDFAQNLKKARERGVGVVDMADASNPHIYSEAAPFSLFGVRRIDLKRAPKAKRDLLQQAEQTFLNGNPVKGCQSVCEELESITRAFALRSQQEGWWRTPLKGEKAPMKNLESGPWAHVLNDLARLLDLQQVRKKCPLINDGLIASVRALTEIRNLTSHPPKDFKQAIERDRKLRTSFEGAHDVLIQWYDAVKTLKL